MRRILAAVALCTLTGPAWAAMQQKPVEWTVGKERFSGYLVYDDAVEKPLPGLVMFPNWMGVTDLSVDKARQIAGDDYVVLVADVYGNGVRPADAAALRPRACGTARGSRRGSVRWRA